jgi:preflagellin peptidase FlaK
LESILDTARIVLALCFFIYASWSDYKTREVSNNVWIFFAPSAFALTFTKLFLYNASQLPLYGLCFGLTSSLAILLFYSGGFGGADSKALMCLALSLPFYPQNMFSLIPVGLSPISQTLFPITVFSNSILLAAATAVYVLLRNVFWRIRSGKRFFEENHEKESFGRKILVLITGYKVSVNKLKDKKHLYPLEDIKEDSDNSFKRKLIVVPRDENRYEMINRLTKAVEAGKIHESVWATPGLPMLIFITAGLIITLFFGDIIWICIRFLLGQNQ